VGDERRVASPSGEFSQVFAAVRVTALVQCLRFPERKAALGYWRQSTFRVHSGGPGRAWDQ